MTSSANSVRFLVAIQCGMSATCMTLLKWLVPIRCPQSPSRFATLSGEPTAMKFDLLTASKSNPPCSLSDPAARILSCSTEMYPGGASHWGVERA